MLKDLDIIEDLTPLGKGWRDMQRQRDGHWTKGMGLLRPRQRRWHCPKASPAPPPAGRHIDHFQRGAGDSQNVQAALQLLYREAGGSRPISAGDPAVRRLLVVGRGAAAGRRPQEAYRDRGRPQILTQSIRGTAQPKRFRSGPHSWIASLRFSVRRHRDALSLRSASVKTLNRIRVFPIRGWRISGCIILGP